MTNKTLIFKKAPANALQIPVAGEHLVIEDRPWDATAPPPPGGITIEILWASYDLYLRAKMRDPEVESFVPAYPLNGPVTNDAVARVLKSDSPDYKAGDLIQGYFPLAEYATLDKDALTSFLSSGGGKIQNPHGLKDLGLFLGPLGMPGLSAWCGLYELGKPKAGETILISSASGAVGQVVGQVAKLEGLKVIGSVGGDDKLDFILNELKFDGGFNYKKEKPADALKRLAPKGIDIYFDNVGGEHIDAALESMNQWGRVVLCGMASQYKLEPEERYGVKNLLLALAKRISLRPFLVFDEGFGPAYTKDHQAKMQKWLADGSIQAKLAVTDGIDNAANGLIAAFQGKNFGKAVLKIKD
ncbi:hypothetical protein B0H63DRAFT_430575 [Podospora didyma]|uniref:Dehydrogenase FUB6 n=1 Tax=Podospora didyma TaxID=330526 RepID=A0AAE0NSE9_9PEZI|nr:hypothetical protein B0H63DRAFT_430575 [Podospora didyma]